MWPPARSRSGLANVANSLLLSAVGHQLRTNNVIPRHQMAVRRGHQSGSSVLRIPSVSRNPSSSFLKESFNAVMRVEKFRSDAYDPGDATRCNQTD